MNFLRNPWVTGVLVLAALMLVLFRTPGIFPHASARLTAAVAPAPEAPTAAKPVAASVPVIEQAEVEKRLAQWINAPRRDPFHIEAAPVRTISAPAVSPLAQWKLKGIWTQTGGRAAAINNGVYAEGDRLGDFQIERIEENQVWLRGPDGLASLAFKNAPPEAGSKTRQATANPPRSAEKSAGTSPTD